MSASEQQQDEWLGPAFWEQLDRLESQHRRAQTEHELAQRGLNRLTPREVAELHQAWERYCEAIAELDRVAAEFESLRSCAR
jgi:hypothetical protein